MLKPEDAALINQSINQVGNAISVQTTNKAGRKWAAERYNIQRADSLADWEMQNQYNSPAAQMKRLKEAGLNPNLIYGQGAVANNSAPVKGADTPSWKPDPIQFDQGTVLGTYYDAQIKQAQIDNLAVQNTVLTEEAKQKAMQTLAIATGIDKTQFDLGLKKELRGTYVESAKENLNNLIGRNVNLKKQGDKIDADIIYTIDQNTRQWQMQKPKLELAADQVLTEIARKNNLEASEAKIRQAIEIGAQELRIKTKHAELWEAGQNPNDPMWQRMLIDLINNALKKIAGFSLKDLMK